MSATIPISRWQAGLRIAACLLWGCSFWMIAEFIAETANQVRTSTDWSGLLMSLVFLSLFDIGFVALSSWLGWRLWFRWDVSTVRWVVGSLLALALCWSLGTLNQAKNSAAHPIIEAVAPVIALLVGAFLYRKIARALIRFSTLDDPKDIYGQPLGHQGRVKAFAMVLGWSIWMTSEPIDHAWKFSTHPDSLTAFAVNFGPIIAGWGTYKVVLWLMRPRTTRPTPVDGFEVIPNVRPTMPVSRLD